MPALAIIEDATVVNNHFRDILKGALPRATIDQYFTRQEAESALGSKRYDLVLLDIELGTEKVAGVRLIHEIHKVADTPVLVISGQPAEIHRPIMQQLEAWDYLQKPVGDQELVDKVRDILAETKGGTHAEAAPVGSELVIDPTRMKHVVWRGKKVSIPITGQRILAELYRSRGKVVTFEKLFELVGSGKNNANIRKQISNIRRELSEADETFDRIHSVVMSGFVWQDPDG